MSGEDFRVVVVDDVSEIAESVAQLLSADGYNVRTANGAVQALALIREFLPECVLLDIDMPGIDGKELSNRLRALYGDDMVLIAITGWGLPDDRLSDAFANFDHYLRKPLAPGLLRKVLPPVSA